MELAIIGPILMALGAISLHMAIERQRKSGEPALIPAVNLSLLRRRQAPIVITPTRRTGGEDLSREDVLLAETLTELLSVKEQLAELQSRVDSLSGPAPEPQQLGLKIEGA